MKCLISILLCLIAIPAYADTELSIGGNSQSRGARGSATALSIAGESLSLAGRYDYAHSNGTAMVDKGFIRMGFDQNSAPWGAWAFVQPGFNHVRGIKFEALSGGGPKYTFPEAQGLKSSLSVGLLHHWQSAKQIMRLSVRPKASIGNVSLVAFYQPRIGKAEDYIASGELAVRMAVSERVGLKYSLFDEYRSIPEGKKNELSQLVMVTLKGD